MIKPDGVQRGLVGTIISRFEDKGLQLVGLKMLEATDDILGEHYAELKDRPFFPSLLAYIQSGPVVAMCWQGLRAVTVCRGILGVTDPAKAAPGTIRGDFGLQPGRNIIHGSDAVQSGVKEVSLWFADSELVEWSPAQRPWVYDS